MSNNLSGIIIKTTDNYAVIKYRVHDQCMECGACASPETYLEIPKEEGFTVGKSVAIATSNHYNPSIIFIEFFIPFLSVPVGLIFGKYISFLLETKLPLTMTLCTLLCFVSSCAFAYWYDCRQNSFHPVSSKQHSAC